MAPDFETCPYCGRKIIKGAMRCLGCGRILKTADEQQESIRRFKESQKSFAFGKLLKFIFFILFLLALGVVWQFYSDRIVAFIKNLLN